MNEKSQIEPGGDTSLFLNDMDEDIQLINGEFYTKPAAPVRIPRETIEGWLADSERSLANAESAKADYLSAQDETIRLHTRKVQKLRQFLQNLPE